MRESKLYVFIPSVAYTLDTYDTGEGIGNANVLIISQVFLSRELNEIYPYGCEIEILLVPSEKRTSFKVESIISRPGDDTNPTASRTVAILPGIDTLDMYAIYGLKFVIVDELTSNRFTLLVIVEKAELI